MSLNALKIEPAEIGGFIVFRDGEQGRYNPPLFAGSLTDCLETMRAHFARPPLNPTVPVNHGDPLKSFRKDWIG